MSTHHGGPVILKPIDEIAKYIKKLIPANIPENYSINPMFKDIANEKSIREGIIAYRNFLYLFCDHLNSDGHLYFSLKKKPVNETDYPFLYEITDLLSNIGYHSKLSDNNNSLLVTELPSFIAVIDDNGNKIKPKNSGTKLIKCLRFLEFCGFVFNGIDLKEKKVNISDLEFLEVSYPKNPILLTGLKIMSIADIELRKKRYKHDFNHDNLLICDYRLIKTEDTDVIDILKDFLYPLPEKVREMSLNLHRHCIDMGMVCVPIISIFEVHFAYSYIKNKNRKLSVKDIYQMRMWEFALSVRHDYCLVVRSKKTDKYLDVIEKFPSVLQKKIEKGYGCDRKLYNEPCQRGCQGFRFSLDDSILNIGDSIEVWLDNEFSTYFKK